MFDMLFIQWFVQGQCCRFMLGQSVERLSNGVRTGLFTQLFTVCIINNSNAHIKSCYINKQSLFALLMISLYTLNVATSQIHGIQCSYKCLW
jgi:hypothetical protein